MTKIIEWLTDRPKLKIFWMCEVRGNESTADGKFVGTHLILLVDVVNVRLKPVAVRTWDLEVEIPGRDKIRAIRRFIPVGFTLDLKDGSRYPADFSKASLDERTFGEPLQYGKFARGWLRFTIPGISVEQFDAVNEYLLTAKDAFGNAHRMKCSRENVGTGKIFFRGAGMQTN